MPLDETGSRCTTFPFTPGKQFDQAKPFAVSFPAWSRTAMRLLQCAEHSPGTGIPHLPRRPQARAHRRFGCGRGPCARILGPWTGSRAGRVDPGDARYQHPGNLRARRETPVAIVPTTLFDKSESGSTLCVLPLCVGLWRTLAQTSAAQSFIQRQLYTSGFRLFWRRSHGPRCAHSRLLNLMVFPSKGVILRQEIVVAVFRNTT